MKTFFLSLFFIIFLAGCGKNEISESFKCDYMEYCLMGGNFIVKNNIPSFNDNIVFVSVVDMRDPSDTINCIDVRKNLKLGDSVDVIWFVLANSNIDNTLKTWNLPGSFVIATRK